MTEWWFLLRQSRSAERQGGEGCGGGLPLGRRSAQGSTNEEVDKESLYHGAGGHARRGSGLHVCAVFPGCNGVVRSGEHFSQYYH